MGNRGSSIRVLDVVLMIEQDDIDVRENVLMSVSL